MSRQYVGVQFRKGVGRTYTYQNDGDPVAVGDEVEITGKSGGKQRVHVVEITGEKPKFETKPIIGLAPPEQPKPASDLFPG